MSKWMTILAAAAVALAVGWLARGPISAGAGAAADSNSDMIAVTGEDGTGASVLWVVDTKAKQLAVYRAPSGRSVEFVAARNIKWDLRMVGHSDKTGDRYHPFRLEKDYQKYLRTGGTPVGEDEAAGTTSSDADAMPPADGK